jgi:uncharacterized RDD family membrane protein YckC
MGEPRERRSLLDRAVGAARGRVEEQVAQTTQGVIDDLEPYLASETVPRIVDALVPHLIEQVVPQVIDGIIDQLATTTVPTVLEKLTPALADELLPSILERLRPYLEDELVPAVVDGVTPHVIRVTAPRVIEGLMPRITSEVVPAVLDGIADDPRIRALVREQSWGLVTDGVERLRRLLAEGDDAAERVVRRVLRVRRTVPDALPAEDRPPGRTRSHAGLVSRLVGSVVDLVLVSFLATQGLAGLIAVLEALVETVPQLVVVVLTAGVGLLVPVYLALAWRLAGCTLGGLVAGYSVVAAAGHRLGLLPAAVRAVLSVLVVVVWAVGLLPGVVDPARRGWLDRLVGSRTPYRAVTSGVVRGDLRVDG